MHGINSSINCGAYTDVTVPPYFLLFRRHNMSHPPWCFAFPSRAGPEFRMWLFPPIDEDAGTIDEMEIALPTQWHQYNLSCSDSWKHRMRIIATTTYDRGELLVSKKNLRSRDSLAN